jgi:four helix bundle protein
MPTDIDLRTFEFALNVITLGRTLPKTNDGVVISRQLVRSATSIGANVEEARAGYSKHEYSYRMNVALREARKHIIGCGWSKLRSL